MPADTPLLPLLAGGDGTATSNGDGSVERDDEPSPTRASSPSPSKKAGTTEPATEAATKSGGARRLLAAVRDWVRHHA
jgi:hypothetical protein